ncbi:MAG TPA: hypothetical protein VFB60_07185 [Ktedonobacteraceae bacterium]|nr:hypothetical protein [Ktedonobacteraceae bacterium]
MCAVVYKRILLAKDILQGKQRELERPCGAENSARTALSAERAL